VKFSEKQSEISEIKSEKMKKNTEHLTRNLFSDRLMIWKFWNGKARLRQKKSYRQSWDVLEEIEKMIPEKLISETISI